MIVGLVFVLVGIFVATVAAAVVWDRREGLDGQAAQREETRRALMRMPKTRIAAVKNGDRVCIEGRALPRGSLRTSPISQRSCIGFRLTVDSKHGGDWHR